MILTFTIVSIFSLFYSSVGKEIKFKILLDWKEDANRKFKELCVLCLKYDDNKALKFTRKLFFCLGVFVFLFYWGISKLPTSINFEHTGIIEVGMYVLLLALGFKNNKEVIRDAKGFFKEILDLLVKVLVIFILIVYYSFIQPPLNLSEYIFKNSIVIATTILLFSGVLFVIYVLFPYVITFLMALSMKFVFQQILKYDKGDSIAGLLRYFSYLCACASLIQFILLLTI